MAGFPVLKITGLAHDGRGIGFMRDAMRPEARGKAVFVAGALPGQTVSFIPRKDRGSYLEGVLSRILDTEWQVSEYCCPQGNECGACPLRPMPYADQLAWKERLALDAMLRIGKFKESALLDAWQKPLPSPLLNGFRNKAELAFGRDAAGNFALGFRKRSSHEVQTLETCAALPQGAAEIVRACLALASGTGLGPYAPPAQAEAPGRNFQGFWRFLVLRHSRTLDDPAFRWRAICVTSPGNALERKLVRRLGQELLSACPGLGCFVHEERKSLDNYAQGQKRVFCLDMRGRANPLACRMAMPIGARLFELDIASFFQVNSGGASLLGQLALDMDGLCSRPDEAGLLDLYCGVGAPGLLLAEKYPFLLGVESDGRAVALARKNAARFGLAQCSYRAGNVEAVSAQICAGSKKWAGVLLDPPRQGLSPQSLSRILDLKPRFIIYISCNPATMARDSSFIRKEYTLLKLAAVDLFPHTPHLECCGLWLRGE